MTSPYQEAVLRHRRAGGTWPPKPAGPRWSGTARGRVLPRWSSRLRPVGAPIRCAECGEEAASILTASCALCGASL